MKPAETSYTETEEVIVPTNNSANNQGVMPQGVMPHTLSDTIAEFESEAAWQKHEQLTSPTEKHVGHTATGALVEQNRPSAQKVTIQAPTAKVAAAIESNRKPASYQAYRREFTPTTPEKPITTIPPTTPSPSKGSAADNCEQSPYPSC